MIFFHFQHDRKTQKNTQQKEKFMIFIGTNEGRNEKERREIF